MAIDGSANSIWRFASRDHSTVDEELSTMNKESLGILEYCQESAVQLNLLKEAVEEVRVLIESIPKYSGKGKADKQSFKFYGQFDPPVDQFIFQRYFRGIEGAGIAVECGAFDGETECSCRFFEETMDWKVLNIEPMPDAFQRLCNNRPKSRNRNFAMSSENEIRSFKEVRHPTLGTNFGNSSLSHTQEHLHDLQNRGCDFVDIKVSTKTWRAFVEEEKLPYIDLFVLDVEGHELSVIQGMEGCTVLPDLICVEIGHLDFEDVRFALHRLGYAYDTSSHVNAFFIHQSKLSLFAFRASAL